MKKPQLINHATAIKPKIKIIVQGGMIQDIIRESCSNVEIEVWDYDIEPDVIENRKTCSKDSTGKLFNLFKFD
jgi:hypothetical protein